MSVSAAISLFVCALCAAAANDALRNGDWIWFALLSGLSLMCGHSTVAKISRSEGR